MDFKELHDIRSPRHPWETARLKAIQKIINPYLFEEIKVLDVGCGDGYVSRHLFNHIRSKNITAVDKFLPDEWTLKIKDLSCGIKYQRELPAEGRYDLILLLDVIEHVEHDHNFLANLVDRYASGKGKVLMTAPAFQVIFSRHDIFLGHYRRYSLKELESMVKMCGLNIISSGYLFFSLLLPKLILYKLINTQNGKIGVGNWNKGKSITKCVEILLNFDNNLLLSFGSLGVKIPGLTGWVLCEKQ